jgi:predicted enzyme related to lactoylglutathione lyase
MKLSMPRRQAGQVIHVELHTDDGAAAVDFLSQLVGWRDAEIRRRTGTYRALEVGNRIGAGIVQCGARPAVWTPYVLIADVTGSTRKAERLGGDVVVEPSEGVAGWRSVVTTPACGVIGLWQPKRP